MSLEHSPVRDGAAAGCTTDRPRVGLLDDFISTHDLARELDCHPRTIRRYCLEPDGLPYVRIAGRTYHPIAGARAFMERRTRHPNPTRKAG